MDKIQFVTTLLFTIKLALQMWCFTKPPPTIIIPVFTDFIAIKFSLLRSGRTIV